MENPVQEAEIASTSSSFATTTPRFRANASKHGDDETSAAAPATPSSSSSINSAATASSSSSSSSEEVKVDKGATPEDSAAAGEKVKKPKESDSETEDKDSEAKTFECNICLDTAKDAVVSPCGHLFCWPCLHQWLETRPNRQSCPVCKAAISREKVIPLYGRGGSGQDPRSKIPPRPTPTRQESPENRFTWGGGGLNGDGGAGSFHLSFGIGAFPFGFFASAFNWGQPGVAGAGANMNPQLEEQEFLSKIFLWVALLFIVWLLLA